MCSRKDCPFTHASKRKIPASPAIISSLLPPSSVKSCKYFPNCKNTACPYYHPKVTFISVNSIKLYIIFLIFNSKIERSVILELNVDQLFVLLFIRTQVMRCPHQYHIRINWNGKQKITSAKENLLFKILSNRQQRHRVENEKFAKC